MDVGAAVGAAAVAFALFAAKRIAEAAFGIVAEAVTGNSMFAEIVAGRMVEAEAEAEGSTAIAVAAEVAEQNIAAAVGIVAVDNTELVVGAVFVGFADSTVELVARDRGLF